MKRVLLFIGTALACASVCVSAFASCDGGKSKKADANQPVATKTYTMPSMPAMITEPGAQAEWAARHFWDNFDFADSTLMGSMADYTEQAIVDWVQLLKNITPELAEVSVGTMFQKAAGNKEMFLHMAEVSEKYLFDANSPYRDDELYIDVLNAVLANPSLDQWERIRPEAQLKLSLKNRLGEKALDFRYTLASGASGSLYGLKAPYTLLFFNNPGCPACRETMNQLMSSEYLGNLIDNGTLRVLAVYPDQDIEAWREYAVNFPASWINSYDRTMTIKSNELYDLKAIPTMYLLDGKKTVMLKDVMSIPMIEQTIYNDMQ